MKKKKKPTASFTIKICCQLAVWDTNKNATEKTLQKCFLKPQKAVNIISRKKWICCIGSKRSVNCKQITVVLVSDGFSVGLRCIIHRSKQHVCLLALTLEILKRPEIRT